MPSEELSLTWDEHHNTLVGVFEKLLETSTLVDCTIAAEGQYLKAHKIILSACSPYFELLFSQENEKNPIVVLKDIKFQELRAIIDFIYSGKVKVPDDRLGDFVDAAESLQIKGLGGDNHEKVSSEKDRNESPHLQRMEVCMSPIPRKRRCPFVSTSEDSVSEIPSGSSINENKNSGNISSHPIQTSTLHCQTEQNSSIASTSSSSPILPVNVQNKQSNIQTNSPVSFAEQLDSPEEVIPRPERVVVKIEPEPMAEVFIPEIDFETKGEEEIEDPQVLDSGGRIAETGIGDMNSLHTPNQFTASSRTSHGVFVGSGKWEVRETMEHPLLIHNLYQSADKSSRTVSQPIESRLNTRHKQCPTQCIPGNYHFVKSRAGKDMLVFRGYVHRHQRSRMYNHYFRCVTKNCTGSVTLRGAFVFNALGGLISEGQAHNHVPQKERLEVMQGSEAMKGVTGMYQVQT